MNEAEVLNVLEEVGAFRSGHFVFVSGLHADTYINKNAMYPYTRQMSKLCEEIARRFKGQGVEAVVGPETGGIILAQWTAHHLSEMEGREVYGVYADKDRSHGSVGEDLQFVIKRGYDQLIKGKKTLVVEDLVTTGGSLRKVVGAARVAGAEVVGAVTLVNRGGVTIDQVGNPPRFESLVTLHLEQWPPETCDLCERGIAINTDVGHGKDFLAQRKAH